MNQFPKPGDTVADRYEIEAEIGAGGSSRVYRAIQTRLERPVALKIISIPPTQDSEAYRRWTGRFERGARILSNLDSPHVVDVYDFGETDDGHLYMAMELLDGPTLQEYNWRDRLPLREAAALAIDLLDALGDAHANGVLHRDIKPENILLADDGEVRLLDFGVAKQLEEETKPNDPGLTQQGTFVGTPRYAAPEYLLGHDLGPWCDIYSLGLVLFEAVTAEPVVSEADSRASLGKHMAPEPFDLTSEYIQDEGFTKILQKMVAKKPSERYRDTKSVAMAFRAYLAGSPGDIPEPGASRVPSIDPNLDHPSEFFVNAPGPDPEDATREDARPPGASPEKIGASATTRENARKNMLSLAEQQARAEKPVSLDTQSIAESHEDEDASNPAPSEAESKQREAPSYRDEASVDVPDHIEHMLESGERSQDRWHRLKWIAFLLLVVLAGGAVAAFVFAPPYWQSRLGLTDLREAGERAVVHPVQDRVAPEHSEVSAEGIFQVVEQSGWEPASKRGDIQTDDMHGWTQDYSLEGTDIRVEVSRFETRKQARRRLDAVSRPNRGIRFARRVTILKPLSGEDSPEVEGLQMMLEEYRSMVDEVNAGD
ncbi:MAG: serine/threonine protein kinase [Myxococcota bacterium]